MQVTLDLDRESASLLQSALARAEHDLFELSNDLQERLGCGAAFNVRRTAEIVGKMRADVRRQMDTQQEDAT